MWLSAALFAVALAMTTATTGQNCSFDPEDDRLWCSLRTLVAQNGTTPFTSASKARKLSIQCSNVLFYESILRTNHFGYLPSLQSLAIESCKIRRLPSLAFSGLSGLAELNICTHNSEWSPMVLEIESDAFTGLNNLQSLNFTHNNLWTVPQSLFCGLASLQALNLSVNYLQDVADLGFSSSDILSCKLPLESLDLSHNSLANIKEGAFGQLTKLKNLQLKSNNLNIIEGKAFSGLKSLQILNLANNKLVSLPKDIFSDASESLSELYLENNSLSVLTAELFNPMKELLVLNLSRNEISNDWINSDTFSSLTKLVALDLSYNKISKIDKNLLDGLVSLQMLSLKHNLISNIEANSFFQQANLRILILSSNLVETIHPKAFSHLQLLNSLLLDHNKLNTIHKNSLRNCTSLQDLGLNNNNLKTVPKAVKSLEILRTLDVAENDISSLKNGSFEGLNNLYGLRMSGNGLAEIEAGAFESVPSLQVLNLAHNKLSKLDQGIFQSMLELRMLRLDNNQLEDINGLLTAQSELRWLNISANKLQWFDYAFIPKNLRWLDIHDNEIEELGNYYLLKSGFNLQTLDASNNKIQKLSAISLPSSLVHAFLNGNRIASIESNTFIEKSALNRVELKDNHLESLDLASLSIAVHSEGSLPEFYLGGNPFFCDCEMEWLQKINQMSINRQYPRVMDLDNVRCRLHNQYHPEVRVMPITHIQKTDFLCPYQAHCFALCMCCAFFACDCRMQCPDGCSCYRDSTWSANIIQCSQRGHVEIPPLIPMDASSIHLDGNNFTGVLESQAFIGRKRVQYLFLNGSRISAISNQTFNGLTGLLTLHLEDNLINRLEGYEFGNLTSLQKLFLQNNRLSFIAPETFSSLISLEELYINDNLIVAFPVWHLLKWSPSLSTISLSGNPWTCKCDFFTNFQEYVRGESIIDFDRISCHDAEAGSTLPIYNNTTCTDAMAVTILSNSVFQHVIPIAVSAIAVCIVIAVSLVIAFVFRTPLKVWLHSRYRIRLFRGCSGASNKDKLYDAFVSYSQKDDHFVQTILAPQLEHENPAYKLCLQHRDMPMQSSIADTLPGISQVCSHHIIIMSRAYLEDEWAKVKFALQDMKKEWRPIVVLLEEPSILDLAAAPEFNLLLKTANIIKWHETGFLNKLRFYLPDSSMLTYNRNVHSVPSRQVGASSTPSTKRKLQWPQQLPSFEPHIHNSSATSTRSTVTGGGASPRTLSSSDASSSSKCDTNHLAQLHSNPLEHLGQDHWSDKSESAYSWQDHTYQTIGAQLGPRRGGLVHHQQHIYHTLDQEEGKYDNLGSLDVMLPNGQMVPATLVRSGSGRIVPLVQMSQANCPSPTVLSPATSVTTVTTMAATPKRPAQHPAAGQMQVTFPKTVVYKTTKISRNGPGYLV